MRRQNRQHCYDSLDTMWLAALSELFTTGQPVRSRDGEVACEILAASYQLDDLEATFLVNPVRKARTWYAMAELLWYLRGEQDITMIKAYAPQYERFANDGKALGSYGDRLANDPMFLEAGYDSDCTQLHAIVNLLRAKPDTRQAVVGLWRADDLTRALDGTTNDIPCTMSWQFIMRDDTLHMVATMRSQDIWLGMPYDVFVNTCMQRLIADELRCGYGSYTHHVGSLHLYDRDVMGAIQAAKWSPSGDDLSLGWTVPLHNAFNGIPDAIQAEQCARVEIGPMVLPDWVNPVLRDAAMICASRWIPVPPAEVSSYLLRRLCFDDHR